MIAINAIMQQSMKSVYVNAECGNTVSDVYIGSIAADTNRSCNFFFGLNTNMGTKAATSSKIVMRSDERKIVWFLNIERVKRTHYFNERQESTENNCHNSSNSSIKGEAEPRNSKSVKNHSNARTEGDRTI
jgi:hypothetical protein